MIDFKNIMLLHLECIYKTLFNCPNISDCVEATNKEKVFRKLVIGSIRKLEYFCSCYKEFYETHLGKNLIRERITDWTQNWSLIFSCHRSKIAARD